MLLAPNRRRTRRRTSSVKRGVSSKDCSHIKLHGWKNAYLSANPDLISFEGRGRKPAADLNENLCLGFLHRLKGYILAPVAVFTFGRLSECSVLKTIGTIGTAETFGTGSSRGTAGTIGTGFSQLCSKRWRASIRRLNGKFFPTIPDDSTGFEAS
jgi:hypothetical protein